LKFTSGAEGRDCIRDGAPTSIERVTTMAGADPGPCETGTAAGIDGDEGVEPGTGTGAAAGGAAGRWGATCFALVAGCTGAFAGCASGFTGPSPPRPSFGGLENKLIA
jgi:hypothetical protein